MKYQYPSKRKQTIQKIAFYSFLFILSLSLFLLDKIKEEKRTTQKTQKIQDTDRSRNVKAYEYQQSHDYINASREFLYVIQNTKDLSDKNKQVAYAYLGRAWSLSQQGRSQESLKTLNIFLEIFKNSSDPYIKNKVKQAKAMIKRAN